MYKLSYQYTFDIDWFCIINNMPIHIASNGGKLPNLYKKKELRELQHRVAMLEPQRQGQPNIILSENHNMETILNMQYDYLLEKNVPMERVKDLYVESFKEMADKGFYSFDRLDPEMAESLHIDNPNSAYMLVAKPNRPLPYRDIEWCHLLKQIEIPDFDIESFEVCDIVGLINKNLRKRR